MLLYLLPVNWLFHYVLYTFPIRCIKKKFKINEIDFARIGKFMGNYA